MPPPTPLPGRAIAVAVAALTAAAPARADVDQDAQVWTALFANGVFDRGSDGRREGRGLLVWADVHARRGAASFVTIARPGLGWQFAPWLQVYAGYAAIVTVPDAAASVTEHRAWQQVTAQRTSADLALQLRARLEQRVRPGAADVGHRVRLFARIGVQPDPALPLGLVVWDEVFAGLNATDWGARAGFDQNRLFLGGFARVGAALRVELGALSLVQQRATGTLVGHVVATNVFASF